MELDKEKAKYIQEVANLGAKVSSLDALIKEKMALHDKIVLDTIEDTKKAQKDALEASKSVLKEIYDAKDELISYSREIKDFADRLIKWNDDILLEITRKTNDVARQNEENTAMIAQIIKDREDIKLQKSLIDSDKKSLLSFKQDLADKQKEINHKLTLISNYERRK